MANPPHYSNPADSRYGRQVPRTSMLGGDGLDHKFVQGWPSHVGLRAQDHVLQGIGDAVTEQRRNYDQGRGGDTGTNLTQLGIAFGYARQIMDNLNLALGGSLLIG